MYYGKIMYCDTANGTGCRTVLFVSGCRHHCKGCFNEIAWKFDYGKEYTPGTEDKIVESLKPDYVEGLSILGGEPLEPENQEEVWKLIKRIRKEMPQKNILVYSGFTWEELTGRPRRDAGVDWLTESGWAISCRILMCWLMVSFRKTKKISCLSFVEAKTRG